MAKNKNVKKGTMKKDYLERKLQEEKQKKFESAWKKLRFLSLASLLFAGLLLIFMLVNWAAVYNTDSGIEVKISGFNCVAAGLSGNYTGTDAAFGDMAVPFHYYAESYVKTLSVLSVIVMFVSIARILVEIFASITNKQGAFNFLGIGFGAAQSALFIWCYSVALSMKDARILAVYCGGNPACSIVSTAILPAVFAILSISIPVLGLILSKKAKKILA